MSSLVVSLIVGATIVLGASGALAVTRWVARDGERKVVLMAAVASWVILFGMLPFFVFSLLAPRAQGLEPAAWQALILNLVPFTLVGAPLAGFVHGITVSRRSGSRPPRSAVQ